MSSNPVSPVYLIVDRHGIPLYGSNGKDEQDAIAAYETRYVPLGSHCGRLPEGYRCIPYYPESVVALDRAIVDKLFAAATKSRVKGWSIELQRGCTEEENILITLEELQAAIAARELEAGRE